MGNSGHTSFVMMLFMLTIFGVSIMVFAWIETTQIVYRVKEGVRSSAESLCVADMDEYMSEGDICFYCENTEYTDPQELTEEYCEWAFEKFQSLLETNLVSDVYLQEYEIINFTVSNEYRGTTYRSTITGKENGIKESSLSVGIEVILNLPLIGNRTVYFEEKLMLNQQF